jgi:general secretion pathway protein I
MIALAILGMSLVAISRSHQQSIRAANRAKLTTVATMLARYKMIEVEDKLFDEGFSDFKQEEKQSFKEEGFERFRYTLVVDKVELPSGVNADTLKSAFGSSTDPLKSLGGGGADKGGDKSPTGAAASIGASMLASQFEMIRNTLEQSIRRASIKVQWKEGSQEHEVTVVGYFTDPRKIDAALGGLGGLGGLAPGGGQTPGAPGATGGTGLGTIGPRAVTPMTPAPATGVRR